MRKIALTAAVLGLTATATFAQTPTTFADVDADSNGELSFAELQVVWPDVTDVEFGGADGDASGGLSTDELNSLQPAAVPAPAAEPAAPAGDAGTSLAPAQSLSDPGPQSEAD